MTTEDFVGFLLFVTCDLGTSSLLCFAGGSSSTASALAGTGSLESSLTFVSSTVMAFLGGLPRFFGFKDTSSGTVGETDTADFEVVGLVTVT